jgi:membrane protein required for colicin V production
VALLCIIGLLALKGAWRGFFREAFGLLALACGVGASIFFGQDLAREFSGRWGLQAGAARPAAHAALFVGPYLLLQGIGYALYRLGRSVFLGGADRLAGAVFGILTATLLSGAALSLVSRSGWAASWLTHSRLAGPLAEAFRLTAGWVQRP